MGLMTASSGLTKRKLALADAVPATVLAGDTFYAAGSKELQAGAMPNRGAWSSTISQGGSIMIPEGYHNGNGAVNARNIVCDQLYYGYRNGNSNFNISLSYDYIGFFIVMYWWSDNKTATCKFFLASQLPGTITLTNADNNPSITRNRTISLSGRTLIIQDDTVTSDANAGPVRAVFGIRNA